MKLELGNANCAYFDKETNQLKSYELGAPTVSYFDIGHPRAEAFDYDIDVPAFKQHLYDAVITNKGITNHEVAGVTTGAGVASLLDIVHPDGSWGKHSTDSKPTWVWSDDEKFGRIVAEFYGVPFGRPAEVELTHFTVNGPPGTEGPLTPHIVDVVKDIKALLVNTGRDMWAQGQGRSTNVLAQQTATASSSTSITGTGTPFTASAYIGMICVDNTTGVWGNIQSNTTSAITVDRWYNPATPAGTAGSTPGTTDKFTIVQGISPAQFMGITANATAAGATDTQLPSEIVTSGGGLIRTQTTYGHSAGTNTYTAAVTFTANGSDSLPVTIAKMGLFNSMVVASTINMWFETLLSATATLTTSGDSVSITDTITGS